MIEVIAYNSFIKTKFYCDEKTGKVNATEEIGVSADADMGSDFVAYRILTTFDDGKFHEKINSLSRAMEAFHVTDADAVKGMV
ncbi:hypothetical protein U3516DRAFT_851783 [Neocallimastix sp. 'constans']